ncbi:uncharacterized protein BCR38DRAFT_413256 [Pseudomassariella vexata]|uniref:Uncharacterized protein n=1 Tax=Pseudomassariella vexata TaxID=1141098 RepID=A0A1Y2DHW6_9PEZI|nr:uncharacterized protein BCR38DRAFT_413256 [Pseudomassariella vexata]ORY58385.1 hypothetical protein BCR38DRAFT_413256 [Pseudomassariella vexata]
MSMVESTIQRKIGADSWIMLLRVQHQSACITMQCKESSPIRLQATGVAISHSRNMDSSVDPCLGTLIFRQKHWDRHTRGRTIMPGVAHLNAQSSGPIKATPKLGRRHALVFGPTAENIASTCSSKALGITRHNALQTRAPPPMSLPDVGDDPKQYSDCCLSISATILEALTQTLKDATGAGLGLVLSVGSGSGLLEALLLSKWQASGDCKLSIQGVEVGTGVNKYLPEDCYSTVKGTWQLSSHATDATALMFVYPRSPELVSRYLQSSAMPGSHVQAALWLSHKSDWASFKQCFERVPGFRAVELVEESGLLEYEMLAVIRRAEM